MTDEGDAGIFRRHAAAVIGDADVRRPAVADLADHVAGSGVEGIFQQLLDNGSRALHHLTRGNQIGNMRGENIDHRHAFTSCSGF